MMVQNGNGVSAIGVSTQVFNANEFERIKIQITDTRAWVLEASVHNDCTFETSMCENV